MDGCCQSAVGSRCVSFPAGCSSTRLCSLFFFTASPPTEIYTLSLHDALPICERARRDLGIDIVFDLVDGIDGLQRAVTDRKSTRLNSSHVASSYAGFCLKKKISPWPRLRS